MAAITRCQSCSSPDLESVLDLGMHALCNELRPIEAPPAPQTTYPLELVRCAKCTLVQLSYVPDSSIVFPESYPYRSGVTKQLRDNFADLAAEVRGLIKLKPSDLVVDIGSNDGTLLSNFVGTEVLGVTPEDAAKTANEQGIETWQRYFSRGVAHEIVDATHYAQVITCTNCFAHVPRPHDFLGGVTILLAEDGVFVTESTYWADTVRDCSWDVCYSEHARYLALQSIVPMLACHGLEVFHVKRIPTHGGSIRVYAARTGEREVRPSVAEMLAGEAEALTPEALHGFAARVRSTRQELRRFFAASDGSVHGIGAPSRGSTLVSYCGITEAEMPVTYESAGSPKLGHYLPGTRIRIVEEPAEFGADQPAYLLLLSHHIAPELIPKLRQKGFRGRFVRPIPSVAFIGEEPS